MDDMGGDGGVEREAQVPTILSTTRAANRGRCRTVVEQLQLGGVFSPDEVKALLRAALPLAADATARRKPRDYRAAMSVVIACAQLDHEEARRLGLIPSGDTNVSVNLNISVDQVVEARERAIRWRDERFGANGTAADGAPSSNGKSGEGAEHAK